MRKQKKIFIVRTRNHETDKIAARLYNKFTFQKKKNKPNIHSIKSDSKSETKSFTGFCFAFRIFQLGN